MKEYSMNVHEVTLVIRTPAGANPPSEWDWPTLLDEDSDNVEFVGERFMAATWESMVTDSEEV